MKNKIFFSLSYIVLGVLLALVPTVLLVPCSSEEKKMACYYTSRAEVGLGILIAFLGIAAIIFAQEGIRVGISIAQLGIAIIAILLPLKITGLCKMDTMACRVKTLPGIIVVSVLLIILSLINIVYLLILEKTKNK